jgi:hypothetical protein
MSCGKHCLGHRLFHGLPASEWIKYQNNKYHAFTKPRLKEKLRQLWENLNHEK